MKRTIRTRLAAFFGGIALVTIGISSAYGDVSAQNPNSILFVNDWRACNQLKDALTKSGLAGKMIPGDCEDVISEIGTGLDLSIQNPLAPQHFRAPLAISREACEQAAASMTGQLGVRSDDPSHPQDIETPIFAHCDLTGPDQGVLSVTLDPHAKDARNLEISSSAEKSQGANEEYGFGSAIPAAGAGSIAGILR